MGRRWGKTVLGGAISLATASQGGSVAWIVPTYKNGRSLWRFAENAVASLRKAKLATVNRTERTIEFANGGVFGIHSADNEDSVRGENFNLVILDEAARISETAWTSAIQPTLADLDGDAILISTPRGRNWFWQEYQRGITDGVYQKSWTAPSRANPNKRIQEAAERAKGRVNELTYRQEWLGEFVDAEGLVFRRVQEAAVLTPQEPQAGRQYVAGVDVAASVDYTVVTVMDAESKEQVYMDRFNRVDYPVLIDRLESVYHRYHLTSMVVESNSIGRPVIDELVSRGLNIVPFTTTSATKQGIIQNLQSAFENGLIRVLDEPVLIGELLSFEAKRNASGSFSYSAPDGMHDDCLLAGTLIKTNEGYKPIENIEVGDLVLTHLGNFKRVEALIKKPFSGQFYKVKPLCNLTLGVSYNHPLYAAKRDYTGDLSGEFTRRDWVLPGDWKKSYRAVSIKQPIENQTLFELTEGDYYQNGKKSGNRKLRRVTIDKNFALLTGRFAADGHCKKYGFYCLELAFNNNEQEDIKFYLDYLNGLGIKARYELIAGTNAGKIIFSSKLLYHIFLDTYRDDGERKLPKWVWKIGELIADVYEGWMAADGCEIRGHLIGCSTSKQLALEIRDIAMAIGKYATIQELRNRKRYGKPSKDQYWVAVHDNWMYTAGQRKVSDFEYISSAKVNGYFYEGDVYNLQVADDRSFIANGVVVHNCVMSLAIAWHGVNDGGVILWMD
jgi:phage terminase large subunit-like protein